MNLKRAIGFDPELTPSERTDESRSLLRYINLQLIANGLAHFEGIADILAQHLILIADQGIAS